MGSQRIDPKKPRRRSLAAQLETLEVRIGQLERDQLRLRNTIRPLARENHLTVGGSCPRCDRSYMLIKRGMMYCPSCGNRFTA